MTDEATLLPCPFCGVEPLERFEKNINGPKYPDHWFVWCENLGCGPGGESMEETREAAHAAWNTRAPSHEAGPQAPAGVPQEAWDAIQRGEYTIMPPLGDSRREAGTQEPVAWTNEAQLGFLKDPAYADIPMAMWGKPWKSGNVALFAAPQPASIAQEIEALKHDIERHQANLASAEATIDLLESNARVQAKLLADTGRERDALANAQQPVKPPYPTEPADKKLAADWYTWGFQAGLEAERRGAARDRNAQAALTPCPYRFDEKCLLESDEIGPCLCANPVAQAKPDCGAWRPIETRPELDHQPGRQFILLEGSRRHSDANWYRQWAGEACIRKPGQPDEMLQYRMDDILRLCNDGDIDPHTAKVTHWMPARLPPYPSVTSTSSWSAA